jgi:Glycosyl transferases group 1
MKFLTWHVHGNYLYYLSQCKNEFFIPVKEGRPEGYGGLPKGGLPWPENLHEVDASSVKDLSLDGVIYQSELNYLVDRHEILTDEQMSLPSLYIEHNPPTQNATDSFHPAKDSSSIVVHVTHYNQLMWDCGSSSTVVIPHGVMLASHGAYDGNVARGLTVINHLRERGRRLGRDVFERVSKRIPLSLAGMGNHEPWESLGEVSWQNLPNLFRTHRFFFNPIRYTSLGLAVCEAMMAGMPIVGLATTEMPRIIENGVNGFVSNCEAELCEFMNALLKDHQKSLKLSKNAEAYAHAHFNITRFKMDWEKLFSSL